MRRVPGRLVEGEEHYLCDSEPLSPPTLYPADLVNWSMSMSSDISRRHHILALAC